ncbi:MAG: hypothetical protein KGJ23_03995 [Euryarchaeota archaeon]|nr:hypothetical protein [Euryarchaeota archaeon]MDE1835761.1 hypothetical protein [Euryarchaeota archaeon]MDE1881535.1 hypothetical protein [Euryarchaeota archaeon]MDE2043952.1 hypothetical protein [Thermoplasmata archaeon]
MASEVPTKKTKGSPEEGPSPASNDLDVLDDLLDQLSEVPAAPASEGTGSSEPTAEAPADPSVAPPPSESPGAAAEALPPAVDPRVEELSRAMDLARAEATSLRAALASQQNVETELRKELTEVRSALSLAQEKLGAAAGKFLPAVPVAFLSKDGKKIDRRAFYALGRGEALELFLSGLFADWTSGGLRLVPTFDRGTLTLTLERDPEGRFLRLLPSGVFLVRLSAEELERVGVLPSLVRVRKGAAPEGVPSS